MPETAAVKPITDLKEKLRVLHRSALNYSHHPRADAFAQAMTLCDVAIADITGPYPATPAVDAAAMGAAVDRYFVDQRVGNIAVRDRQNTDLNYQGLHDDTDGVVWYRHGVQGGTGNWELQSSLVDDAHTECSRLNALIRPEPQGETPMLNAALSTAAETPHVQGNPTCWCHTCHGPQRINDRMILCPTCGNKRCPKATHHNHACTNSNAPGQVGSIFVSPAVNPSETPNAPPVARYACGNEAMVGDVVECVLSPGDFDCEPQVGRQYEVDSMGPSFSGGKMTEKFVDIEGGSWKPHRFKLIRRASQPSEPQPSGQAGEATFVEQQTAVNGDAKEFQREMFLTDITEAACRLMKELGVNRTELAARMGKTKGWITQLLDGSTNMTIGTVSDVFFAMGVSPTLQIAKPSPAAAPEMDGERTSGSSCENAVDRLAHNLNPDARHTYRPAPAQPAPASVEGELIPGEPVPGLPPHCVHDPDVLENSRENHLLGKARDAEDVFSEIAADKPAEQPSSYSYKEGMDAAISIVEDYLDAIAAQPEAEGVWQPIATAPKDGTELLTWYPIGGSGFHKIGGWSRRAECWLISGDGAYSPTHWMPLPKPATESSHKNGGE